MAILEGNLALLEANGLADFDALYRAADANRVDGHRWRSVSRLELRDPASGALAVVYVKRQWGRAARRPWRDLLRLHWPELPARREWHNARGLQAAGIPIAEPIAFGHAAEGAEPRSILAFREVPGQSLAARMLQLPSAPDRGPSARSRHALARELGAAVRRLHDAGLSFPDLYAKHVYVDEADPSAPRIAFIDPQRLRRRTRRRAAADLAALLATATHSAVTRADRMRVLRSYLGGPLTDTARPFIALIERHAARLAGRGGDPNLLPGRRSAPPGMVPLAEETMTDADGGRLSLNEAFRPALQAAGLTSLDAIMNFQGGRPYREVAGRSTVRVELAAPGGRTQVVYLKRHTRVPWLTALWRTIRLGEPVSFAMAEARHVVRLADVGIPTMRIVAVGEELTRRGRRERSCLLTEEVAGAVQADDYCERAFATDPSPAAVAAKRRLVRALARLARRFHAAGFTHRDFYLCHFLVRPVEGGDPALHLIDLQRMRRHRPGAASRRIVKDLAALLFSSTPSPATGIHSRVFTRTDRMRFAREYFETRRLSPAHKRLIRLAVAKARSIARHEARRQARRGTTGGSP